MDDTWARIFTALKYRLLEYYEEDQTDGKESREQDEPHTGADYHRKDIIYEEIPDDN